MSRELRKQRRVTCRRYRARHWTGNWEGKTDLWLLSYFFVSGFIYFSSGIRNKYGYFEFRNICIYIFELGWLFNISNSSNFFHKFYTLLFSPSFVFSLSQILSTRRKLNRQIDITYIKTLMLFDNFCHNRGGPVYYRKLHLATFENYFHMDFVVNCNKWNVRVVKGAFRESRRTI